MSRRGGTTQLAKSGQGIALRQRAGRARGFGCSVCSMGPSVLLVRGHAAVHTEYVRTQGERVVLARMKGREAEW